MRSGGSFAGYVNSFVLTGLGGVAEQPEDDGQEDSSEGAETTDPLT